MLCTQQYFSDQRVPWILIFEIVKKYIIKSIVYIHFNEKKNQNHPKNKFRIVKNLLLQNDSKKKIVFIIG